MNIQRGPSEAGTDRDLARRAERVRRAAHQRAAVDRCRAGVGVAAGRRLQRRHAAVNGEGGRSADTVDRAASRRDPFTLVSVPFSTTPPARLPARLTVLIVCAIAAEIERAAGIDRRRR